MSERTLTPCKNPTGCCSTPIACGYDCHYLPPATPPTPESDAHREVRESVVCEKCYGLTSCWCPPTPDRAAVREAVLAAVRELRPWHPSGLPPRMGSHGYAAAWAKVEAALDTALAAVSRPAEARVEPTDAEVDAALKSLEVTHHWNTPTRDRVRLALKCANQAAAPLPAPSGGEGQQPLVFEPEECLMCGVEETVLAPHQTLCSPCTIKMLHPDSHIPPMGEVALAAPRPEPGEVSEAAQALVEKLDVVHADPRYLGVWMGAVAHGGEYVGPTYEAELNALRAALAAREGA